MKVLVGLVIVGAVVVLARKTRKYKYPDMRVKFLSEADLNNPWPYVTDPINGDRIYLYT
jgi:hypothetical protein